MTPAAIFNPCEQNSKILLAVIGVRDIPRK